MSIIIVIVAAPAPVQTCKEARNTLAAIRWSFVAAVDGIVALILCMQVSQVW
jgi:hypothetical protein